MFEGGIRHILTPDSWLLAPGSGVHRTPEPLTGDLVTKAVFALGLIGR